MSYRALYRQYRPRTFGEVVGQEHITTILKNQIRAGQAAHAYLFTGTRGTGKTSTAKILSRAVNCLSPEDGEPCGKCEACLATAGECVDILEMDAASNSRVDDMRAILEKVQFMPLQLRMKVYIIDEAHALSAAAINALLKTLEEPPAHVMFILATTEPQKMLATIVSRCQRFDFHRLSMADMVARMEDVLAQVPATIERDGLTAIARAAEGGMRDALSLADQCLSFCGDHVSAADVYSVLGSVEDAMLFDIAQALLLPDAAQALRLLDRVIQNGRDVKVFAHDLALHFRALPLAKACGNCADLLECTQDAMQRYLAQAERAGEAQLLRAEDILLETEPKLGYFSLPRALLESALVRIARPQGETTPEALLQRIDLLEKQAAQGALNPPAKAGREKLPAAQAEPLAPPAAPPASPAAAPQTPPAQAQKGESLSPKQLWADVVSKLNERDKAKALLARQAEKISLQDGVLSVGYRSQPYYQALSKPEIRDLLQGILDEAAPNGYTLRIVYTGGGGMEETARALFGDILDVK